MKVPKILMVEDDVDLSSVMKLHIEDMGYEVDTVADGNEGLSKALAQDYDLIILDWMLPGMPGFEICRGIREKNKSVPILMLTSRSEELDKVVGLDSGADDFVTKPYKLAEVSARIRALLRRSNIGTGGQAEGQEAQRKFGDLTIDIFRHQAFRGERDIGLTAKEFEVVELLSRHPGRPYTRDEILEFVWETTTSTYESSVSLIISRIRKKLEDDPEQPVFVTTVRGIGYRFSNPAD